jgi:hypothetical protein
MSASGIILTLVLLGTIVAGHTDHPVFWLLVGPAPLGIGFTVIMFFRQGLGRNHFLPTVPEQNGDSSGRSKQVVGYGDEERSKQQGCARIVTEY